MQAMDQCSLCRSRSSQGQDGLRLHGRAVRSRRGRARNTNFLTGEDDEDEDEELNRELKAIEAQLLAHQKTIKRRQYKRLDQFVQDMDQITEAHSNHYDRLSILQHPTIDFVFHHTKPPPHKRKSEPNKKKRTSK
jgi:hypothetical protein